MDLALNNRQKKKNVHMDVAVLADQQEVIYISSGMTQDVVWMTCR